MYLHILTSLGLSFAQQHEIKVLQWHESSQRHKNVLLHLLMLSSVSSSLNNLAKPSISSLVTDSPIRTCLAFTYVRKHKDFSSHLTCLRLEIALFINSSRSSAVLWRSPLLVVLISSAICLTVSCKNFAYSILAFSFLFNASCWNPLVFYDFDLKVSNKLSTIVRKICVRLV